MTEVEQLDADLDFLYERRRQLIAEPRKLDVDYRDADIKQVTKMINSTEKKRRKAIIWETMHPRHPSKQ